MPKIVIVDDRPLMARGLLTSLSGAPTGDSPEHEVVAVDVTRAAAAIERERPDVVVVAVPVAAPEAPALELMADIAASAAAPVVALVSDVTPGSCRLVMEMGCAGAVGESALPHEVVRAVTVVAGGGEYLDPTVVSALLAGRHAGRRPRVTVGTPLSGRELDVLELVAEGLTGDDIAARLHVAPSTVKTHLKHVFGKLDARDRAHAVAIGFRSGILS